MRSARLRSESPLEAGKRESLDNLRKDYPAGRAKTNRSIVERKVGVKDKSFRDESHRNGLFANTFSDRSDFGLKRC
jgi:hypothetical protein